MTKPKFLCFLFSLMLLSGISYAQSTSKSLAVEVEVTYAEHLGTIPAVRTLIPLPPTDPERRKMGKKPKRIPQNFIGRKKHTVTRPDLAHQGPDPVRQTSFRGNSIEVEPLVNMQGIFNGSSPHDPTGDVGRDHYVQAINATSIGVFDKEGNHIQTFNANTLWSQIGFSSAGDPIVMYDQEAERWLITEFPPGNQLLVAISKDSDPLGQYDAYNFATPNFPDYPKYGVWNNAYSVTTNEQGGGVLHAYFINRQALLDLEASVPIQRISLPGNTNTEQGFFTATPVEWSGLTPPTTDPIIVALNDSSWGATPEDAVEVYSVSLDWDNPNNTTFTSTTVVTSPYNAYACAAPGAGFACIPQSGGGGLDGVPEVILNIPHYRNFGSHEAMVMCFMADIDGNETAGIRWVEMRRLPGGEWFTHQDGTVGIDDGFHRFMGSIAMDGAGNIGLGYNISSPNSFAGVRFTGRRSSDPLGEMTVTEYVAADGQNAINSGGRFGDYSHMEVDPVNDRTFWFTTEYASNNQVRTRIVAFELGRDTIDINPTALLTPVSSPDLTAMETVQMEVKNVGIDSVDGFHVGYIFENGTAVVDTVDMILAPDSIYQHTFVETVDMSAVGSYEFRIFTALETDQAPLNDTLRAIVQKIPFLDASIVSIDIPAGLNCGESQDLGYTLTNFGADTLTSVTIHIILNGVAVDSVDWTGTLAMGESETLSVTLTDVINGANEVVITASNPNGAADEIDVNNSASGSFDILTDGVMISLMLLTDNFPEETTWEVSNENGDVLYEGGPYNQDATLETESFCLDPDDCYVFTIFDAYGDGICCGFGQGNYSIVDENGSPLLTSTGEFGAEETNDFCATFTCMMTADIDIASETEVGAMDGVIMITALNGVGPYMYSIDGGETFQESNMFSGLSGGDFEVVVQGQFDCLFTESVTVETCALSIMATITDASDVGSSNGRILVTVSNGTGPYQYSINGGDTFQGSNLFLNLAPGEYDVVVQDALGCETMLVVNVGPMTSTNQVNFGQLITLYPNPTDGMFRIEIEGLERSSVFLPLGVYDVNGKLVYESSIVRYDNTYKGMLSLYQYPSGVYFVRFYDNNINKMLRVVRK